MRRRSAGSFKNLLTWTSGGTEIADKPVAWINVAAPGRGRGAVNTLETVLVYVAAQVVRDACLVVPVGRADVDDNGVTRNQQSAIAGPDLEPSAMTSTRVSR
ncbi:NAD(P)H-dependent oxidoreductase [Rhodococcus sp. NPDC056516]|uniref:NAD(P)H-dependent oxidoreductase n=1 Tax=Rhodococcus sp. NPDC056516 TaxID=3345847 RepID=UPI00366ED9B1